MSTMRFEQLARDVRYAARGLWRDRSFTASTVATLTVALALVTVVFTIFNAYVLRPYAVRDPYSLYEVRWHSRSVGSAPTRWAQSGRTFRWRDYQELQRHRDLFDAVIAERNRSVISDGMPLLAAFVSGNYFESLGGRIPLGRALAGFDAQTPGAGSGRRPQRPGLDPGLRPRPRGDRPHDQTERSDAHGRRRDGGGVHRPQRHAAGSLGPGDDARSGHQAGSVRRHPAA